MKNRLLNTENESSLRENKIGVWHFFVKINRHGVFLGGKKYALFKIILSKYVVHEFSFLLSVSLT